MKHSNCFMTHSLSFKDIHYICTITDHNNWKPDLNSTKSYYATKVVCPSPFKLLPNRFLSKYFELVCVNTNLTSYSYPIRNILNKSGKKWFQKVFLSIFVFNLVCSEGNPLPQVCFANFAGLVQISLFLSFSLSDLGLLGYAQTRI